MTSKNNAQFFPILRSSPCLGDGVCQNQIVRVRLRAVNVAIIFLAVVGLDVIAMAQQVAPLNHRNAIPVQRADEPEDLDDAWQQGAFPRMTRQSMRESLFSGLGGSEAAFQKSRREKIRRELDRVNSICPLTDEQKEKLEMAIDIDIQHLLTKIETVLSKYDSKMTVQQFQQIQVEVQQLVGTIPSSKQENEIWRKVLKSQLTAEQKALLDQDMQLTEQNRLRTEQLKILLSLQRKLGLTKPQREAVSEWLKKERNSSLPFSRILKRLENDKDLSITWTPTQQRVLKTPVSDVLPPNEPFGIAPIELLPQLPRLR
ncbi:MAG: hypothetical protein ABL921_00200 [Pirellula sp.]